MKKKKDFRWSCWPPSRNRELDVPGILRRRALNVPQAVETSTTTLSIMNQCHKPLEYYQTDPGRPVVNAEVIKPSLMKLRSGVSEEE
jgi:hypothetical protein